MSENTRERTIGFFNKYGVTPQERFSQNFLVDDGAINKIIRTISLDKINQIVEIGSGLGALTFPLVKTGKPVTAIEFDRDMVKVLSSEIHDKNFDIYQKDFMKQDLNEFHMKHVAYIGNLPYQISRDLIKKILCDSDFEYFGFMVQKELAEKLIYKEGSSLNNPYSVFIALRGRAEIAFDLTSGMFYPSPRVDSSFVVFTPENNEYADQKMFNILLALFKSPKKNIINNLKLSQYQIPQEQMKLNGISVLKRAHELTLKQFGILLNLILKDSKNTI